LSKVRCDSTSTNRCASRRFSSHVKPDAAGRAQRFGTTQLVGDRPRPDCQQEDLSPELFTRFQTLIYNEAGIWLGPHKTALLIGRLSKRLRSLNLRGMWEYFKFVTQPEQQHERVRMIDCITTNETRFFREPRHFEFLAQTVFPRWREEVSTGARAARIRIWSAGCSSGEEPYSLAMMLLDHFGDDFGWKLEILATDISTRVLEEARAGIFPVGESKDIPAKYLNSYLLRGIGEQQGYMKVSQEVQTLVTFSRLNLHADYNMPDSFDLIFLRNVMIYFDQRSKSKVLAGILRHLSPRGYLFVGHSESLQGLDTSLRAVTSSVYSGVQGDHPGNGAGGSESKDLYALAMRAGCNGR